MTKKWVDVKTWDEFEIGMKFRDSKREYTVTKVFADEIHATDGSYPYGYFSRRDTFHAKKYQRLETAVTEEEAPTADWVSVKNWSDVGKGDRLKIIHTGNVYQIMKKKGLIFDLKHIPSGRMYSGINYSTVPRNECLIWQEDLVPASGPDDFLEKVFSQPEPEYTPKKISDHPHTCIHCGSDSYNGEWSIDCKGNCAASRKS